MLFQKGTMALGGRGTRALSPEGRQGARGHYSLQGSPGWEAHLPLGLKGPVLSSCPWANARQLHPTPTWGCGAPELKGRSHFGSAAERLPGARPT